MSERSIAVVGLPGSGKTTFLAALWHVVTMRDIETALTLEKLGAGDRSHLNQIASRWREAKEQDHTSLIGDHIVSMHLKKSDGASARFSFPDVAGESFQRMWESRECDQSLVDQIGNSGVLFFVHADTIQRPLWVADVNALAKAMGLVPAEATEPVQWTPRLSPTQVAIVDLLQLMHTQPLDVGKRRLAIIFSAWDKVEKENLTPAAFLNDRLPLLAQYLTSATDPWEWRVYGLSAQGGPYDDIDPAAVPNDQAKSLRELERASDRIKLISNTTIDSHDVTEPLAWLMN